MCITGLTGVHNLFGQFTQRRQGHCSIPPASSPSLRRFNRRSREFQNCPYPLSIPRSFSLSHPPVLSPFRRRRRPLAASVRSGTPAAAGDLRRPDFSSGELPVLPFLVSFLHRAASYALARARRRLAAPPPKLAAPPLLSTSCPAASAPCAALLPLTTYLRRFAPSCSNHLPPITFVHCLHCSIMLTISLDPLFCFSLITIVHVHSCSTSIHPKILSH